MSDIRIAQLRRKQVFIALGGSPGALAIGLALYALVVGSGDDVFLPILNNSLVVYSLLGFGILVWIITLILTLKTSFELRKLQSK